MVWVGTSVPTRGVVFQWASWHYKDRPQVRLAQKRVQYIHTNTIGGGGGGIKPPKGPDNQIYITQITKNQKKKGNFFKPKN